MAVPAGFVLRAGGQAASKLGEALVEAARTPLIKREHLRTWVDEAGQPHATRTEAAVPAWVPVALAALIGRGLRTGVVGIENRAVPTQEPNPDHDSCKARTSASGVTPSAVCSAAV